MRNALQPLLRHGFVLSWWDKLSVSVESREGAEIMCFEQIFNVWLAPAAEAKLAKNSGRGRSRVSSAVPGRL